jgi:hypothetical protein
MLSPLYGPLRTVNVDCVKFEYVVLAKYHHMLIGAISNLITWVLNFFLSATIRLIYRDGWPIC